MEKKQLELCDWNLSIGVALDTDVYLMRGINCLILQTGLCYLSVTAAFIQRMTCYLPFFVQLIKCSLLTCCGTQTSEQNESRVVHTVKYYPLALISVDIVRSDFVGIEVS